MRPPDLSYRYELPLTPNLTPETTVIMSTRGNQRQAERVGWFDFLVGTTAVRLEYNPACAYSDHYNCPIPPRANILSVAIRAGEMDSQYH